MESQIELMHDEIIKIVTTCLRDTLEITAASKIDPALVTADTRLVGHSAVLDSMGLVSLILDIEQQVNEKYDVLIIIADERAMSQKQSPFRSVGTLSEYVLLLVKEQAASGDA